MKIKLVFLLCLGALVSFAQNPQDLFRNCGVDGSTAIYDYNKQNWTITDTADGQKAMQPASTFKIINLLIALETGVINDENDIVRWPGKTDTTLYGYRPEIYHDISVKEAFEVSAGWAFIELAKKIDRKTYQLYLTRAGYGNEDLSEKGDDFWNFGPFGISPRNQVEFLMKVYEGKTPFSKRNVDILKRVMLTEETTDYKLRSKTGWTRVAGNDIGWWVGYVERKGNVFFFATRITKKRSTVNNDFGSCRKTITKAILKQIGGL